MKKFFIAFGCLFSLNFAFAQTQIGLQAGANRSRFWGDDTYGKYHSAITSPSFGAVLNRGLTKHLSLSTGIQYERTGSAMKDLYFEATSGSNNFVKANWKTMMNYLSIPLITNYDFGKKRTFGFGGGLFASYLLSAKNKFEYQTPNTGLPEGGKNKEYGHFNFGVSANAHYRLALPNNKCLVFSLEDHLGLKNFDNVYNEKRKTNSVGVYASFLIGLK